VKKRPDARWDPSPPYVVEEMLWLGGVTEKDTVYDLGCGDGRLVVAAAQLGARAVGFEIHPRRLELCRINAAKARVTDRVRFVEQDLFEVAFHKATVVMLYLLPELNLRLRPRLLAELPGGARIVSHSHDMGDWQPERVVKVRKSFIYVWVV
jgi:ribosomal protein L11 methylase PrmA